jgi:hypothetical protein
VTVDLGWTSNPWLVAINVLATFRITRLLVADAFPFGALRLRLTDWANDRWGPLQRVLAKDKSLTATTLQAGDTTKVAAYDGTAPLAYLITCPWCASPYVAVAVAALASTGAWWVYPAAVLAVSAIVGLLATLTD